MDKAEPQVGELGKLLAGWFDAGMERVAGWYKRQVTWFLLAVAAVVTVAVDADTMRIAEQLWQDDALRTAIVAAAEESVAAGEISGIDERAELRAFPLGYPDPFAGITWRMIVGWLLIIAAISLGAPFWFDLLGKIVHTVGRVRWRGWRVVVTDRLVCPGVADLPPTLGPPPAWCGRRPV